MKVFYFNSGVKPWNTDVERQVKAGNKFINNELHFPFYVPDEVPDNATLLHLCLYEPESFYKEDENFIIADVIGGNMISKYAIFLKPKKN